MSVFALQRAHPDVTAAVRITEMVEGMDGLRKRVESLPEYRDGVRVNAIAPSPFNTPMVERVLFTEPEYRQRVVSKIPIGRIVEPEAIIGAILFLASPLRTWSPEQYFQSIEATPPNDRRSPGYNRTSHISNLHSAVKSRVVAAQDDLIADS